MEQPSKAVWLGRRLRIFCSLGIMDSRARKFEPKRLDVVYCTLYKNNEKYTKNICYSSVFCMPVAYVEIGKKFIILYFLD